MPLWNTGGMSKKTDKHDRIRLWPENAKALKTIRDNSTIPTTIPSLANAIIQDGAKKILKPN